jgi:hypothetical protein
MRRMFTLLVFSSLLAFSQDSVAQMGPKGPGMGQGGGGKFGARYMRMFDAKTVAAFSGTVTKVEKVVMMEGHTGVHIKLKMADGEMQVHLGPDWFIENQEVQVAVGDKLELTGSKVNTPKGPAILAMEIKRGDDVLKLRDAEGMPYWVAWRKKS